MTFLCLKNKLYESIELSLDNRCLTIFLFLDHMWGANTMIKCVCPLPDLDVCRCATFGGLLTTCFSLPGSIFSKGS